MHTQSAISTNERQASNTRPAVLGATGRLLSAYYCPAVMTVRWTVIGRKNLLLLDFPATGQTQNFHPLKHASAGRTKEKCQRNV